MHRLISLLKEKNHYLEKFHSINELEMANFSVGNFDHLDVFYQTREQILDLISCIDGLLQEEMQVKVHRTPSADDKILIAEYLHRKDHWVRTILAQDLQVMSYIESEKSNIIRELGGLKMGRKVLSSYNSSPRPITVDEKA